MGGKVEGGSARRESEVNASGEPCLECLAWWKSLRVPGSGSREFACQFVLSPAFCRNLGENYSVSVASELFVLLTRVQGGLQQPPGALIPRM